VNCPHSVCGGADRDIPTTQPLSVAYCREGSVSAVASSRRPQRERLPFVRRETPNPALDLQAGVRLYSAILLAQVGLDAAGDRIAIAEELRGALAYTAALGETCLVAPAANAVRVACEHLRIGRAGEAKAELTDAEKHLGMVPPQVSRQSGAETILA
jgi:hypothetical protein